MRTAIVLFTRDLRVNDHPALASACANAERVVPLFVLDPTLLGRSPNRTRFLHQALADLRETLRGKGADLVVRRGDPVAETIRLAREVGADGIALTADVSGYAKRRQARLADEGAEHRISVRSFPGVCVVDPGDVLPGGGGDHYKVFSPYYRAWESAKWRAEVATPARIDLPDGLDPGELPAPPTGDSPRTAVGGETEGRRRVTTWLQHLAPYADLHDDLPADGTSRLSPYLRFGCVSPLALATAARKLDGPGPAAFVRQLGWRDFYYQVMDAFPKLSSEAYRKAGDNGWRYDADAMQHWQDGLTGVPVVDAGMRQLQEEGWMHNRARLITASFLTKHLGLDWRPGVRWFSRWLLDGDVANNSGNWQWVAGTGNDTKPYRRFNPIRQAERFDPEGRTCAGTSPNCAALPELRCTNRGGCPPRSSAPSTTPSRWSPTATRRSGSGRRTCPVRRAGMESVARRPVASVRSGPAGPRSRGRETGAACGLCRRQRQGRCHENGGHQPGPPSPPHNRLRVFPLPRRSRIGGGRGQLRTPVRFFGSATGSR